MVITALTRNQVYRQRYRGFESHPLRQKGTALETQVSKAVPFLFLFGLQGGGRVQYWAPQCSKSHSSM